MTRRERFIQRRARYLARAERQRRRGHFWAEGPPGVWKRVGRKWPLERGPLCRDYLHHTGDRPHGNPMIDPGAPFTLVVSDATRFNPPHVTLLFAGVPWDGLKAYSVEHAIAGYHRRRVKATRWVSARRGKAWRQDWGARMFAHFNGHWPDWDVHHRHPTLQDVLDGAPGVPEDPFPPPAA